MNNYLFKKKPKYYLNVQKMYIIKLFKESNINNPGQFSRNKRKPHQDRSDIITPSTSTSNNIAQ